MTVNTNTLRERALLIAQANIGYGETEANNRGPFIQAIGGDKLNLKDPEWCAIFAGYTYRKAWSVLYPSQTPPAWLFRRKDIPEPGALRLVNGMASVGRRFTDPAKAQGGDFGLLKRTGGHHVFIVERIDAGSMFVNTIAGNEGRFPSKVRRHVRDVERDPNFKYFATLRGAL